MNVKKEQEVAALVNERWRPPSQSTCNQMKSLVMSKLLKVVWCIFCNYIPINCNRRKGGAFFNPWYQKITHIKQHIKIYVFVYYFNAPFTSKITLSKWHILSLSQDGWLAWCRHRLITCSTNHNLFFLRFLSVACKIRPKVIPLISVVWTQHLSTMRWACHPIKLINYLLPLGNHLNL